MADPLSIAASIVSIATAGIQISVKIATLAGQVSTASDRISTIGNDICLTSGILHQLADLTRKRSTRDHATIFTKEGLKTTRSSAEICRAIFNEIEKETAKACELIRGRKDCLGEKIKLSMIEKAKWPFLQPGSETLRTDLREAKGTLMLMVQIASLALSQQMSTRLNDFSSTSSEQKDTIRSIYILQQQQGSQEAGSDIETPRDFLLNTTTSPNSDAVTGLKGPDQGLELQIFALEPEIRARPPHKIVIEWHYTKYPIHESEIHAELTKYQTKGFPSVLDSLEPLQRYERALIEQKIQDAFPMVSASLRSFKRTERHMQFKGMEFNAIPSFVVIVQVDRQLTREKERLRSRHHGHHPRDLIRPTYLRVHRKHLLPETLDEFGLPWEWDEKNMDHILIKTWISEDEQEALFDHTKMLRQQQLKEQKQLTEVVIEAKRATRKKVQSRHDDSVDDHKSASRERMQHKLLSLESAPESDDERRELATVNELLRKYTKAQSFR